jgi:hypothetical protein
MEIQSATQAAFQQLRLQQAQRNAERAEQLAGALRGQAADARREADRAQENARELAVRSSQADDAAGRAHRGLALIESVGGMQATLSAVLDRVSGAAENGKTSRMPAFTTAAPVVNTTGQMTGTVVNTVA